MITDDIERKNGEGDQNTRNNGHPWGVSHVGDTSLEHVAPGGVGRLDTEA